MWARVTVTFADGSETECEVGTDTAAYPDAARECVARVIDLYRETCTSGANDGD